VAIARDSLGGAIHLDPCSNPQSIVKARVAFELPHIDGLLADWHVHGDNGYANPPFGTVRMHRETKEIIDADAWRAHVKYGNHPPEALAMYERKTIGMWIEKARIQHETHGFESLLLLPAAVDTGPWHKHIWPAAAAVGFFSGRLKFIGAESCAPMACAMVYFGHRPRRFSAAFEPHGKVVRP
jgi:hypothetical protein